MAGDEITKFPVVKLHLSTPVVPLAGGLMAYSLPSYEPTYAVPSAPMAGDELTSFPVVKLHLSTPVVPLAGGLMAYKLLSHEPTYSVPSAPMAGDECTPCTRPRDDGVSRPSLSDSKGFPLAEDLWGYPPRSQNSAPRDRLLNLAARVETGSTGA
jgi:hypothetical protein